MRYRSGRPPRSLNDSKKSTELVADSVEISVGLAIPDELDIGDRWQSIRGRWYDGQEVLRLRVSRTAEGKEVVCTPGHSRRGASGPFLLELLIDKVSPLGRFDVGEGNAASSHRFPVDRSLVVGNVDAAHRILRRVEPIQLKSTAAMQRQRRTEEHRQRDRGSRRPHPHRPAFRHRAA